MCFYVCTLNYPVYEWCYILELALPSVALPVVKLQSQYDNHCLNLISLRFSDINVLATTEKTKIHRKISTKRRHVFIFKDFTSCSLCCHLLKHAWSSSSRVCSFVSLVEKTERSMTLLKYLPLLTTQGRRNERRPYWNPASDWFSVSNINRMGSRGALTSFLCLFMLLSLNITLCILARTETVVLHFFAGFIGK